MELACEKNKIFLGKSVPVAITVRNRKHAVGMPEAFGVTCQGNKPVEDTLYACVTAQHICRCSDDNFVGVLYHSDYKFEIVLDAAL